MNILPGINLYIRYYILVLCVCISDVIGCYSSAVLLAGGRLGARPPANHLCNETEMIGEGSIPPSASNRDLRGVLE